MEQPDSNLPTPHILPESGYRDNFLKCVAICDSEELSLSPIVLIPDVAECKNMWLSSNTRGITPTNLPGGSLETVVWKSIINSIQSEDSNRGDPVFLALEIDVRQVPESSEAALPTHSYINGEIPGLSYDPAANMLTLTNYKRPKGFVCVQNMGHDFIIKLEGSNEVKMMSVDGGSLSFVGSGSLKMECFSLDGRETDACLMIGDPVTMHIEDQVVVITQADRGICYTDAVCMKNTVRAETGETGYSPTGDRCFWLISLESLSAEMLNRWIHQEKITAGQGYAITAIEISPP